MAEVMSMSVVERYGRGGRLVGYRPHLYTFVKRITSWIYRQQTWPRDVDFKEVTYSLGVKMEFGLLVKAADYEVSYVIPYAGT